jgi:hypothetical protein
MVWVPFAETKGTCRAGAKPGFNSLNPKNLDSRDQAATIFSGDNPDVRFQFRHSFVMKLKYQLAGLHF